jgi:hypothetical protein
MLTTEDTEDTEFLAKRLRGCYRVRDLRAKTSMFDAKRAQIAFIMSFLCDLCALCG